MSTEPNLGPTLDPNGAWCFGPFVDPTGSIAGQQAGYGPGIDPNGAWCFGPFMGPSGSIAGRQADYGPGIDPTGLAPGLSRDRYQEWHRARLLDEPRSLSFAQAGGLASPPAGSPAWRGAALFDQESL